MNRSSNFKKISLLAISIHQGKKDLFPLVNLISVERELVVPGSLKSGANKKVKRKCAL